MQPSNNGDIQLSHTHNYYTQVQGQLAICNRDYCDFICWTPVGIHVERITRDPVHFSIIQPSLDNFFRHVLLPQILKGASGDSSVTQAVAKKYCYCQGEESGKMVACDNPTCVGEWFHYECVGITRKPRGKWYCSDACRSV